MKKIFLVTALLFSVVLSGTALAQEGIDVGVETEVESLTPVSLLLELPNPGLNPGNFFYFLDSWGEAIQEIFTFNPERKAILQTERVLERISEVNAILEKRDVDAPELDIAEAKIERNIERASEILERQKIKGVEVTELAKRLETDFNIRRKLLGQVFNRRRAIFEKEIDEIRDEIKQVRADENLSNVSDLRSSLNEIRQKRDALARRRDIFQDSIISKNRRIRESIAGEHREIRILEREKEALEEEGESAIERVFEEREMEIEAQEEILEIQLNEAILAGNIEEMKIIHNNLREIEVQSEALEIEEYLFEEKMEEEEDDFEESIELILERRGDIGDLRIIANKARVQAKETIEKFLVKAEEQKIHNNPTIMGLIKQAERFHERALIFFEKGEYKKSYLSSRKAMDFARKAFKLISVKENLKRGIYHDSDGALVVPDNILPKDLEVIPDIIRDTDLGEVSPEKIKTKLKIAENFIEETRRLIEHEDVEGITFSMVSKLIEGAENNIDKSESLLKEGILNLANRHATEARGIAEKAHNIIGEKLRSGEIKTFPDPIERRTPVSEVEDRCQTDIDCKNFICPMVVGGDTPQCNRETGKCFCGPGRNIEMLYND